MVDSSNSTDKREPHVVLGTAGEFEMHGLFLPETVRRRKDAQPWDRVTLPASAAVKLALRALDYWGVPKPDWLVILGVTPEQLAQYQTGGYPTAVPELQRVEDVLVIYNALTVLFPDDLAHRTWCTRPNGFFNGQSAAQVMASKGTKVVRRYLEGELQG